MAGVVVLSAALTLQGCFDPVYPQLDRETRVLEALDAAETRELPPAPLSPAQAVAYALSHSIDAKVAEIEAEYQNESRVAARRRLLPSLTARYSLNHSNHAAARWSESTKSGNQSLESSYSSEQTTRQSEIGAMWNIIDFGVGYLRTRQQGERVLHSEQQRRRVRQQIVLDVLTQYWRTAAATAVSAEAETIKAELEKQGEDVRDSVELRILSGAEGARRELAVHNGLAELEQYRRAATQAKLELARVLGCDGTVELHLSGFAGDRVKIPKLPNDNPWTLQAAALKRRPELYQQDAQERIAEDEARLALLQMAPNANLSFNLNHDPDKFLEWNNWMTVGARVSWNLLNIPARMAERRMAKLQGEVAKKKGLALAAAVMAQVGIAFSDWRLSLDYAGALERRAEARERLVEALAAGEKDGQTRPGEVLQERVRLLSERAAALRAAAEVRVAGARLANAIGLDTDDDGNLIWRLDDTESSSPECVDEERATLFYADLEAEKTFPDRLSGLRVVKAEDFLAPAEYFEMPVRKSAPTEGKDGKSSEKDSTDGKPKSDEKKKSAAGEKKPSNKNAASTTDKKTKNDASAKKDARAENPGKPERGDRLEKDAANTRSPAPKTDGGASGETDGGDTKSMDSVDPKKTKGKKKAKTNQLQTMTAPMGEFGELPRTAFVDNFAASPTADDGAAQTYRIESHSIESSALAVPWEPTIISPQSVPAESLATSSAGTVPYALAKADPAEAEREMARSKALAPLTALKREPSLRPPKTRVTLPPSSLKPPGK